MTLMPSKSSATVWAFRQAASVWLGDRRVRLWPLSPTHKPESSLRRGGVIADSEAAGDRVKINRRDATMLARRNRAGELTPVWVPITITKPFAT